MSAVPKTAVAPAGGADPPLNPPTAFEERPGEGRDVLRDGELLEELFPSARTSQESSASANGEIIGGRQRSTNGVEGAPAMPTEDAKPVQPRASPSSVELMKRPLRGAQTNAEMEGPLPRTLTNTETPSSRRVPNVTPYTPASKASCISEDEVTRRAHFLYLLIYGFAHWFGAHRFDRDGDGKFDAKDVQRGYNDLGRFLRISFRGPTIKATKKAQRRREKASGPQPEAKPRTRRPSTGSNSATMAEFAIEEILGGSEVLGEFAVEEVIQEHLRQFYPWFSIVWALVILGLWVGYALQMEAYHRTSINAAYKREWILESVANPSMQQQVCEKECSIKEACKGFAFEFSPGADCILLTKVAKGDGVCSGAREFCGVYQFRRASKSVSDIIVLKAGLDTAYPGQTDLAGRDFCQDGLMLEMWRLLTYQFTHVGLQHVLFNALLVLAFGIALEGAYGTLWMGILWTMGVIGGGLAWGFWDAHTPTVGASGGCYSLIGMHAADTFLNWNSKKYKWIILFVCVVILTIETVLAYGIFGLDGMTSSSHVVHFGGGVAGFVFGFVFGLDLHPEYRCNRIGKFLIGGLGIGLLLFSSVWWCAANPFPATRSIFEDEAQCWVGQVCIRADGQLNCGSYTCVSCDNQECMESWYPRDESGNVDKANFATARTSDSVCAELGYTKYSNGAP